MSKPGGDPSSGISSGDAWDGPSGIRHVGGAKLDQAFVRNVRTCASVTSNDVKGQAASGSNRKGESTEAGRRGEAARSSVEGPVMGLERRGCGDFGAPSAARAADPERIGAPSI